MQRHGHFTEQLFTVFRLDYRHWPWWIVASLGVGPFGVSGRRVLWGDQDLDRGYKELESQRRAWSAMQTADYSIVIFTTLPDP